MGLSLLVSLVSLEYGSMSSERGPLALFLILRSISYENLYRCESKWAYEHMRGVKADFPNFSKKHMNWNIQRSL